MHPAPWERFDDDERRAAEVRADDERHVDDERRREEERNDELYREDDSEGYRYDYGH